MALYPHVWYLGDSFVGQNLDWGILIATLDTGSMNHALIIHEIQANAHYVYITKMEAPKG